MASWMRWYARPPSEWLRTCFETNRSPPPGAEFFGEGSGMPSLRPTLDARRARSRGSTESGRGRGRR
jgi:hypothetical protein